MVSKPSIVNSNDDDIVDTTPIDNIITSHTNIDISNRNESSTDLPKVFVEVRDHPHDMVIGDISQGVQTRSKLNYMINVSFISLIEPKNVKETVLMNFGSLQCKKN